MREWLSFLFSSQGIEKLLLGWVSFNSSVINYRLTHEYELKCQFVAKNYFKACWITTDNEEQLESFMKAKYNLLARDKDDNLVFLAETPFLLQMAEKDYPDLTFHKTSEFMLDK